MVMSALRIGRICVFNFYMDITRSHSKADYFHNETFARPSYHFVYRKILNRAIQRFEHRFALCLLMYWSNQTALEAYCDNTAKYTNHYQIVYIYQITDLLVLRNIHWRLVFWFQTLWSCNYVQFWFQPCKSQCWITETQLFVIQFLTFYYFHIGNKIIFITISYHYIIFCIWVIYVIN